MLCKYDHDFFWNQFINFQGTERTDIIDLSEFEADSNDILHVGHIVLTHEGHKITQAV